MKSVAGAKAETFYWITITFSQTFGTALGDWIADAGLGYLGGALVFGAALAVTAAFYFWTNISRVTLFWAAFMLTPPLGATVGDFLDKPMDKGPSHLPYWRLRLSFLSGQSRNGLESIVMFHCSWQIKAVDFALRRAINQFSVV